MGATTLINVAVKLFHDHEKLGGRGFLIFLWAMWWIDVGISFICCWIGLHVMYDSAPLHLNCRLMLTKDHPPIPLTRVDVSYVVAPSGHSDCRFIDGWHFKPFAGGIQCEAGTGYSDCVSLHGHSWAFSGSHDSRDISPKINYVWNPITEEYSFRLHPIGSDWASRVLDPFDRRGVPHVAPKSHNVQLVFRLHESHTDNHKRLLHLFIVHSLVFSHHVDDLRIPRPIFRSSSFFYLIQNYLLGSCVSECMSHIVQRKEINYD